VETTTEVTDGSHRRLRRSSPWSRPVRPGGRPGCRRGRPTASSRGAVDDPPERDRRRTHPRSTV